MKQSKALSEGVRMDGSAGQKKHGATGSKWNEVDRLICLGCLVLFFNLWPYPEACGILVLCPGIEPALPALEGRVLTTGPLGKSLFCF